MSEYDYKYEYGYEDEHKGEIELIVIFNIIKSAYNHLSNNNGLNIVYNK